MNWPTKKISIELIFKSRLYCIQAHLLTERLAVAYRFAPVVSSEMIFPRFCP